MPVVHAHTLATQIGGAINATVAANENRLDEVFAPSVLGT
jgi:hypothetical protein